MPVRKVPKTLQAAADELYRVGAEKTAANKLVKDLEKFENQIKKFMTEEMERRKITVIGGKLAKIELKPKKIPTVEDWPKFYAFVAKTKSWDLLQKRLSEPAIRERWDDNKQIPGVGRFPITKVSCTKL